MQDGIWRIELLGGLRAKRDSVELNRFRTQKTGALLAYLAFHGGKPQSREALINFLWPDCDITLGRNSLSAALSALRRDLEPPGETFIIADRANVGLDSAKFSTDVAEFEDALRKAESSEGAARIEALTCAVEAYRGRLLPEFYEDWIALEARRLEEAYFRALRQLVVALRKDGEVLRAIQFAERGVAIDSAREEAQRDLVQLYAVAGQLSAARRQYAELERHLAAQGATPSGVTRQMMEEIERRAQIAPAAKVQPRTTENSVSNVATPTVVSASTQVEESTENTQATSQNNERALRLPAQLTRFFGRETEIKRLLEMLNAPDFRFVTVTGPGGSGKTRLCVEATRHFSGSYNGDIYFVALADLQDASLLPEAILDALRGRAVSGPSATSSLEKVVESLSGKPALLVLDNFEQLVSGGGALVRSLVESVPNLRVLITSRQRLGVRGEREFVLMPLPTPRAQEALDSPEMLEKYVSVQLFVDRAGAVRSDFVLQPSNAPTIAQLCRRLDGIPLAIELAAARSKVLAPAQMLARLEKSLDVLATGHKDVEDRHRSLRATMEWSFDLLPAELQQFWTKLGVFRGGWTLEASEEVCQEPLALEWLEQLQEASLVLAKEGDGGEMRFRLLETLREYALEQLSPEELAQREECYAQFFEALAEQASQELSGPGQGAWLRRLESEQDNFRAVLAWLLENAPSRALHLSADLAPFWEARGHFSEGRSWIERALECCRGAGEVIDSKVETQTQNQLGWFAFYATDFAQSEEHHQTALAQARQQQNIRGQIEALAGLAVNSALKNDFVQMRTFIDEELALIRGLQNTREVARVLPMMVMAGLMTSHSEDLNLSRRVNVELISLSRELGDSLSLAKGLTILSTLENIEENYAKARALLDEALELYRELNEPFFGSYAVWNYGNSLRGQGDGEESRRCYNDSARICRKTGIKIASFYLLESFGQLDIEENNLQRGVKLLGAANALREKNHAAAPVFVTKANEKALQIARKQLDKTEFELLWNAGRKLNVDDAMALATKGNQNPPDGSSPGAPKSPNLSEPHENAKLPHQSAATNAALSSFENSYEYSNCEPQLVARALTGAGRLACFASDFDVAREFLHRSAQISRGNGDDLEVARALNGLGLVEVLAGSFAGAHVYFDEALQLSRLHDDKAGLLHTLVNMGYIIADFTARPETVAMFEEGVELARASGNGRALALMLTNLGLLLIFDGQLAEGVPLVEQSLVETRAVGEKWNEARAQWTLAHGAMWRVPESNDEEFRQRQAKEARQRWSETLRIVRSVKGRWEVTYLCEAFFVLSVAERDYENAGFYWGAAGALRSRFGWPRSPATEPHYERFLEMAKREFDHEKFQLAVERGVAQGETIPVEKALTLLPPEAEAG